MIEGDILKLLTVASNTLFRVEKVIAVILGIVLLVSLAAGVLFRYFLNAPLFWSDELAMFCLAWITFIGGSMCIKMKASPSITMLIDSVKPAARRVISIISTLILLIFIVYVLYLSIVWITGPNIQSQISTSLKWPKFYFYLSVPVSFGFMTIHAVELFIKTVLNKEDEDEEKFEGSID